ncbi:hypothetical protein J437_LFUL010728, partial [Ladona fulva]
MNPFTLFLIKMYHHLRRMCHLKKTGGLFYSYLEDGRQIGNQLGNDMTAGAQDTIYLCNFRVSVDGEWLCLKELQDVEFSMPGQYHQPIACSPHSPDDPPMSLLARDPAVIERSNLGILGPKKELWDILQMVEKYSAEAQDITASVRDLPTVSTHMGRARAWLRLALMQKKLADYLKVLVDHKEDVLCEYYEPEALLMSDEAIVIVGLLVGLNVIDCNLCVKEEDLDCPQGVIDFSLYLRSSHHLVGGDNGDCSGKGENEDGNGEDGENHMTTVLDQKNYIEELNRHLNATVTNLQSKVESLTATNALMKEDLAIAKNTILSLHEENCNLRKELGHDVHSERIDEGGGELSAKKKDGGDSDSLKHQIELEKKQRLELQKELDLQ